MQMNREIMQRVCCKTLVKKKLKKGKSGGQLDRICKRDVRG